MYTAHKISRLILIDEFLFGTLFEYLGIDTQHLMVLLAVVHVRCNSCRALDGQQYYIAAWMQRFLWPKSHAYRQAGFAGFMFGGGHSEHTHMKLALEHLWMGVMQGHQYTGVPIDVGNGMDMVVGTFARPVHDSMTGSGVVISSLLFWLRRSIEFYFGIDSQPTRFAANKICVWLSLNDV